MVASASEDNVLQIWQPVRSGKGGRALASLTPLSDVLDGASIPIFSAMHVRTTKKICARTAGRGLIRWHSAAFGTVQSIKALEADEADFLLDEGSMDEEVLD